MNVTYPITFTLNYPSLSTLSPGQTFTISSSWSTGTPTASPSLVTTSPNFGAKLDGVMEVPNAYLHISGRAFGEWVFRTTIFDQTINFNHTLIDTKDVQPGTKDLFEGILGTAYTQPVINLTGNLVPATFRGPQTDLHAYGATQNADRSGTGFFTLNGNFSNAIGYVAGKLLGIPRLKFSDSIDKSFSALGYTCGFSGGYDILSLIGSAGVGLEEEVLFHPNPQVTLVVNEGNGNNRRVVTFPAGGSVQLTMPADGTGLFIDPYVSLDNTFRNRVSAYASAALNFYPFDISCTLSLPGYTLPTLSYSIPSINLVRVQSRLGDVYNNTFKLGGFDDQFLPEIALIPPPPPPATQLAAQDHFYTASLQTDNTGSYYYLYVFPAQGVLSDAEGPSALQAVPQDWTPDPTNPNFFFRLTAAGGIEFKYPAGTPTGQFQRSYQITDGQGHFASANIYITLGSGG